MSAFEGGLR